MVANNVQNNFYFYFGFLGFYFSAGFFAYLKNVQTSQMRNLKFKLN